MCFGTSHPNGTASGTDDTPMRHPGAILGVDETLRVLCAVSEDATLGWEMVIKSEVTKRMFSLTVLTFDL